MSCLFSRDFDWCGYNVGGINKLYIMDHYLFTGYNQDKQGRIDSFKNPGIWIELDLDLTVGSFNEEQSGITYNQQIGFNIDKLSYDKRNTIEQLRDRRVCFILQDNNEKWWFVGEKGFKLNQETSIIASGTNNYTLLFSTKAHNKAREISEDVIDTIVICNSCNCFQYWDELALSSTVTLAEIWNCLVDEFGTVNGVILPPP